MLLPWFLSTAQAIPVPVLVPSPILLSLELPIVARDLRHDGIAPAEVSAVIVGSRKRHIHCDEIHATLLRSHQAFLVSGPIPHFDDLVLVQLDRGLRGPDLYVFLDHAYEKHGKHKHDDDVVVVGHESAWVVGHEPGNSHGNASFNGYKNNNSKGSKGHGGGSHGKGHGK